MNWFRKQEPIPAPKEASAANQPTPIAPREALPPRPAAAAPSEAAITAALDAFIQAPGWDDTRQVLEARQAVLLSLEARLALVGRLEREGDARQRGILGTCAHLLLLAAERGIPAAWDWLDSRKHAYEQQLEQLVEQIVEQAPPEQREELRATLAQMTPEQRRQLARDWLRQAEAASENRGQTSEEEESAEEVDLSTALQAFLGAPNWSQTFGVLKRYQRVLLTPGAVTALRQFADRLRQDQQEEAAAEIDKHIQILEQARQEGIAAAQKRFQGHPSQPEPVPAPPLDPAKVDEVDTQLYHSQVIRRPPALAERQAARILLEQPGALDETGARALRAWLNEPGAVATDEEIDRALVDLRAAMQFLK